VTAFFEKFLDRFRKYKSTGYRDIDSLKITALRRGGDPIATLPNEIVSDSLMVTGGAAGQSGLAYSMRAGEICGRVAAEAIIAKDTSKQFLSAYPREWRSEFWWEYRAGRACLETLRKMSDEDIDSLFRSLQGRKLVGQGAIYRKAFTAGLALTRARPYLILDIINNLLKG
jgi:digeranylgeranylglycerophospholipid reductase